MVFEVIAIVLAVESVVLFWGSILHLLYILIMWLVKIVKSLRQ